ncbi:MAG: hypothetical protein HPY76_11290, partial [Anaerolineae bacterium]|nr:hypothetical protein [Anaerolineae bacterium]
MKTNRYLYAVFLVILTLAACTPGAAPTVSSTPSPTPAPPRQPTASLTPLVTPTRFPGEDVHPLDLDGQTVRFIHPWAGELGDQVAAIIADFNRTNLFNIEVEVIQAGSSNALTDIVAASLDQATRPQLAVASLDQIQYWQSISPVTVDVQPYIDDPEWGLQPDEIADLIPTYLNALRIDDKLLGLPATVDVNLLFYNQTWAKELGFSNPPV